MSPHFSPKQPPHSTTATPNGRGGPDTPNTPGTLNGQGALAEVTLPDGRILHLPLPVQGADSALPASTLAQLVWMSGQVDPPALCSGLGRCGRCAVRFTRGTPAPPPADEAHFSPVELSDGWRLLCRHAPSGPVSLHGNEYGMAFTLPWAANLIASASVFLVVFVTMMYSMSKVKKENIVDALKNENL